MWAILSHLSNFRHCRLIIDALTTAMQDSHAYLLTVIRIIPESVLHEHTTWEQAANRKGQVVVWEIAIQSNTSVEKLKGSAPLLSPSPGASKDWAWSLAEQRSAEIWSFRKCISGPVRFSIATPRTPQLKKG